MIITYQTGDPIYTIVGGEPIFHSLSPAMQNTLFARYGLSGHMIPVNVKQGELPVFFSCLQSMRIRGFNVTMPHKRTAADLCDELDPVAAVCGAVNCVCVGKEGKTHGYNTDAVGCRYGVEAAGFSYDNQDIMIIGAGGVATPIAYEMAKTAKSITFVNRTIASAEQAARLIERHTGCKTGFCEFTLSNLCQTARRSTMLFNATSLGMCGVDDDFVDLSFISCLPKGSLVADVVNNPPKTKFQHYAHEHGYPVLNGVPMLIYQGFLTFYHFTGVMPKDEDYDSVVKAMGL